MGATTSDLPHKISVCSPASLSRAGSGQTFLAPLVNEGCLHLAPRSERLHRRDLKCAQAVVLTNRYTISEHKAIGAEVVAGFLPDRLGYRSEMQMHLLACG
jgi:hypothetical protein